MDEKTTSRWRPVLERMLEELSTDSPRAESYWAQQIAFGPVFVHAVALAVRNGTFLENELELVRRVVPLALSMLGALPDGEAGDPASLHLLARRQATVLTSGRRRLLTRLVERLGLESSNLATGPVPTRFQRPYPLIGWRPPTPA